MEREGCVPNALGLEEGMEVGLVGFEVGCPVGSPVGVDVGSAEGREVGWLEVGAGVGRFVSPGRVGREVVGALDGTEVGAEEVGMEVGALTILKSPTRTSGLRIRCIVSKVRLFCSSGAAFSWCCATV